MRSAYHTVRAVGAGDVTSSITSGVTETVAEIMMPKIREMMVQEVMPMLMLGLALGAIAAATIGSYFATRRSSVRTNPFRRPMHFRRRRFA